ncbi:unnamed protein product [Auanema sp. JU1783]|nr:unnamed protein product [Auanema sp. JU1783]
MFGGNDPFAGMFRHMQRQMFEMDRVFENMMDPFMLAPGRQGVNQILPAGNPLIPSQHIQRFGGFGLGGMLDPMAMMSNEMMRNPNCQVFSHSSTTTFDGYGRPQVVERTMRSNGDTREERRRYCDGEREETAVQQSIGDRTHIVEKKRDRDGKIRRQQKLINLDESNVDDFNKEFSYRSQRPKIVKQGGSRSQPLQSIGYGQPTFSESERVERIPIITLPEEDEAPSHSDRQPANYGPVIREITDEEGPEVSSYPKRRRDD